MFDETIPAQVNAPVATWSPLPDLDTWVEHEDARFAYVLALVDHDMPVVAVAPNNKLLEKLISNIEEVRARGGQMFVIADSVAHTSFRERHGLVLELDTGGPLLAPVVLTVPLQLLAYHVAVQRGTDVDQPRNLAKSVTVE